MVDTALDTMSIHTFGVLLRKLVFALGWFCGYTVGWLRQGRGKRAFFRIFRSTKRCRKGTAWIFPDFSFYPVTFTGVNGNSNVNIAPCPAPSLWTVKLPPISSAIKALLCNPKPWPSCLVVNPWVNIFVRFSLDIPTPLSATSIRTWSLPCL